MADTVSDVCSHHLFRINSGAIRFKVKAIECKFWLVSRCESFTKLYEIRIGNITSIKNLRSHNEVKAPLNPHGQYVIRNISFIEYWISWYNGCIRVSHPNQNAPCVEYVAEDLDYHNEIGFINFHVPSTSYAPVCWIIEAPPFPVAKIDFKKLEGGEMHWVAMTSNKLPPDAMIGGFEYEHTYIARAYHNGSLCPGKYIPSKGVASVPWGFTEHKKHTDFEILCGYNAEWVQTKSNFVPDNALIAGFSEVGNEPLYIGRAMYDGNLLTGKVHPLYKTCYLPYDGKEIQVESYEILVLAYKDNRGVFIAED